MVQVLFNDQQAMIPAQFKLINKDAVLLIGDAVPENISGFKVYRNNGAFLGDYSEFTSCDKAKNGIIYKRGEHVEFSFDLYKAEHYAF